ncbi:MAG: RimK family alpha-L-glutamate ligase [Planctomycetota bacterium]|jgi:ribosomal protein S6--L-glutamate ligase|nr:RimK family alpha-L-glutamate ligase [Planctomycetota bacterium]
MHIICLSRKPNGYACRKLNEAADQRGCSFQNLSPAELDVRIGDGLFLKTEGVSEPFEMPQARGCRLLPRLGALPVEQALAVIRQFEAASIRSINRSDAIQRTRNKAHAYQVLGDDSLPVPVTFVLANQRELATVTDTLPGDKFIIKLPVGVQGIGVMLAESRASLASILDTFWGLGEPVLVQEYIESAHRDKRAFVVGNEVIACMQRSAHEGDFRSNTHLYGDCTAAELSDEEERLAVRASQALSLDISGVDIAETDAGSVVLEVNQSPGFEALERVTGVDCAGAIMDYVASF